MNQIGWRVRGIVGMREPTVQEKQERNRWTGSVSIKNRPTWHQEVMSKTGWLGQVSGGTIPQPETGR